MSRTARLLAIGTTVPLLATTVIVAPLAQPAFADEVVYTTPGASSFSVPTGVEKIYIEVTGSGGTGGDSGIGRQAGGNGGDSVTIRSYFNIANGPTSLSVLVGQGGGASAVTWNSMTRGVVAGGGGAGGAGGTNGGGGAGGSASATGAGNNGSSGQNAGAGQGGGGGTPPSVGGAGGTGGGAPAANGDPGSTTDGGDPGSGAGAETGGGGGGGAGGGGGGGGGNLGGGGGGGAGGTASTGSSTTSNAPDPGGPGAGGAGGTPVVGQENGSPGENGKVTIIAANAAVASGTAGNASATISWTTPQQPLTTTYQLYQDGVAVAGATSSPATVTGLTNGVEYDFQVRALIGADLPQELSTVSNTVALTPQSPPPPPPVEPVAPKLSKLTIDSPSQLTASVAVTGSGATLSSRTMPTGGQWSAWQTSPAQPTLALPINLATGSWLELRSKSIDGITPITVGYARIVGNPAVRGDVKKKRCRQTPVTAVEYPSSRSATVRLQSKRTCAKYRVSLNDGQSYGKWKKVKSKTLSAPGLTPGSMARMQIKAGKKHTTVWIYSPTQRNDA